MFVAAAPTWGGFYVGANLGVAWTQVGAFKNNTSYCGNSLCGFEADDDNGSGMGALAGITAGYNFQSGNFVYGLEADIAGVWGQGVRNTNYDQKVDTRGIGTIRARLGIANGATLFYLTGGAAAVNQKYAQDTFCSDCNYTGSKTSWRWAPVVGAGIEHSSAAAGRQRLRGFTFRMSTSRVTSSSIRRGRVLPRPSRLSRTSRSSALA